MRIITKVILVTTIIVLVIVVVLSVIISRVSINGDDMTDRHMMQNNINKVSRALSDDVLDLDSTTLDYSRWDASYNFLEGNNINYTTSDLNLGTLATIRVNFVAIILNNGSILLARQYISGVERDLGENDQIYSYIKNDLPEITAGKPEYNYTGVFLFSRGGVILSVEPILKSDWSGPVLGYILMGRILDSDFTKQMSEQLNLNISIYSYNQYLPGDVKLVKEELLKSSSIINMEDENTIVGYTLIRDSYNNPAAIVRIKDNRIVYLQGKTIRGKIFLIASIVCIVLIFLITFFSNLLVIRRISRMKDDMLSIAKSGKFSGRLKEDYNDEISSLAKTVNLAFVNLEKVSEEKKAIFNSNPDAYFHIDHTGHIIDYKLSEYFDKKILEGKKDDELNISLFFSPDMIEKFILAKLESAKSSAPVIVESSITFNNTMKYLEYRIVAMSDNKSLILVRDITDRKSIELELIKKNDELEKFNKFAVDRESRMIEMKIQMAKMKKEGMSE